MKTMSRAAVLALGWLLVGSGLPFGGVPDGAAQTVAAAPSEDRNLDRAIAAQRKRVSEQTRPAERASALNDLANLLELRGDVDGAFEQYRAALAADGRLAPAHYNLALLAYAAGDGELATDHLETAVELDPRNAWAHYQLGRIADDAGDAATAVEHYVHALSLDTRLAFADVNPHFTVNRHATEVLLKADRSRVEALPPRTYSEPGRISGLLLPPIEETAKAAAPGAEEGVAAEAAAPAEPDRDRPRRATRTNGGEDASAEGVRRVVQSPGTLPGSSTAGRASGGTLDSLPRMEVLRTEWQTPETADPDAGTGGAERESADARAGERPRVFTRDHLRTRTLGTGRMVGGSPAGGAPSQFSPVGGSGGGIRPGTPVGPGGRQSTAPASGTFRGSGGRFQPSARSSAQLETTIRRAVPAP